MWSFVKIVVGGEKLQVRNEYPTFAAPLPDPGPTNTLSHKRDFN